MVPPPRDAEHERAVSEFRDEEVGFFHVIADL